jgi:hypothetical protein
MGGSLAVRACVVLLLLGASCTQVHVVDCREEPTVCDARVIVVDGGFDAGSNSQDGGRVDAGPDAGRSDAGRSDAGRSDAGRSDAGTDAGMDAGRDAGMDAGMSDAGCQASEIPGDPADADEDCSGTISCFVDGDNDGYRTSTTVASTDGDCDDAFEARASDPGGDCNDSNSAVNPGALEVPGDATNRDENCDGLVRCYADVDDDNYRTNAIVSAISDSCAGTGVAYASAPLDCCDTDRFTYPGSTRSATVVNSCDSFDYDCDTMIEPDDDALGDCGTAPACDVAVNGWEDSVPSCGSTGRWILSCVQLCDTTPCRCDVYSYSMRTQSCH